jgi:hypothetical protein
MNRCPFCESTLTVTRGFPYHWEYKCPKNADGRYAESERQESASAW